MLITIGGLVIFGGLFEQSQYPITYTTLGECNNALSQSEAIGWDCGNCETIFPSGYSLDCDPSPDECLDGQETCDGTSFKVCISRIQGNIWRDFGIRVGECNVECLDNDNCGSNEDCISYTCESSCISSSEKRCLNGDVYWYDSCGNPQDMYDDCLSNEQCQNAQCIPTRDVCDGVVCQNKCEETTFLSNGYCSGGKCVYEETPDHEQCTDPGLTVDPVLIGIVGGIISLGAIAMISQRKKK